MNTSRRQRVLLQYLPNADILCSMTQEDGTVRFGFPSSSWEEDGLLCSGPAMVDAFAEEGYMLLQGEMCYADPMSLEEVVRYLRQSDYAGTQMVFRIFTGGDVSYYITGVPSKPSTYLLFVQGENPPEVQFTSDYLTRATVYKRTVNELILADTFPNIQSPVNAIFTRYYNCPYYFGDGTFGFNSVDGKTVGEVEGEWLNDVDIPCSELLSFAIKEGIFNTHRLVDTDTTCISLSFANLRYFEHFPWSSILQVLSEVSGLNHRATDVIYNLLEQGEIRYKEVN